MSTPRRLAGVGHAVVMAQPRLVTWGLCTEGMRLLVQFSADETFFRLPGGTIEWGETPPRRSSARAGRSNGEPLLAITTSLGPWTPRATRFASIVAPNVQESPNLWSPGR